MLFSLLRASSLQPSSHFNQAFDGASSLRRSTPYPPFPFPDYFSLPLFLSILLSPFVYLFLTFPHTSFALFQLPGPILCVVDCGNLETPFTLYLLFVLKSVAFVSTFFSPASFCPIFPFFRLRVSFLSRILVLFLVWYCLSPACADHGGLLSS